MPFDSLIPFCESSCIRNASFSSTELQVVRCHLDTVLSDKKRLRAKLQSTDIFKRLIGVLPMRESHLPDRMRSLSYNWDRLFLQLSFILSECSNEGSYLITYILCYRNRRQFHSLHLHLFLCSFEGRICFHTQIRFLPKVFLSFTEINLCFFFLRFVSLTLLSRMISYFYLQKEAVLYVQKEEVLEYLHLMSFMLTTEI